MSLPLLLSTLHAVICMLPQDVSPFLSVMLFIHISLVDTYIHYNMMQLKFHFSTSCFSFDRSFVRTFVACCSYFKREKRNIKWQKFVFCFSFLFSLTHISTTFRGSRGSFRCGYFLLRQINVKNKSSSELNSKIILFFGNKFSFCSFVVMYRSETLFMHLLKQALWEFLWESILEIKASDYKFMNGNVKEGQ